MKEDEKRLEERLEKTRKDKRREQKREEVSSLIYFFNFPKWFNHSFKSTAVDIILCNSYRCLNWLLKHILKIYLLQD